MIVVGLGIHAVEGVSGWDCGSMVRGVMYIIEACVGTSRAGRLVEAGIWDETFGTSS